MFNTRTSSNDPRQGSAFNELVVLPTFAPHLARPYYVPGTAEHHAAIAGRVQEANRQGDGAPAISEGCEVAEAALTQAVPPTVDDALFFVNVTNKWTERPDSKSRGAPPRAKACHDSRNALNKLAVLKMSRADFILATLAAHGNQKMYVVGAASGPDFRVFWARSAGGKTQAPLVQDNEDWQVIQDQLREVVKNPRSKLDTILMVYDLDTMEGFKNRKRAVSPLDPTGQPELDYGTHVPHVGQFTSDEVEVGRIASEIKAAWTCEEHGVCYITGESEHIEIHRIRLNTWASAVVARKLSPADAPPKDLLQSWIGIKPAVGKPRGRSGPNAATILPSASSAGASDSAATLMVATMLPMMTMMAQNMTESMKRGLRSKRQRSITPPSSPPMRSSPPPEISDELDVFLAAFGKAKNISEGLLSTAGNNLRAARYMPDIIPEDFVTIQRLTELTTMAEGEVYALKKFAREWSGKMSAKRAKQKHQ